MAPCVTSVEQHGLEDGIHPQRLTLTIPSLIHHFHRARGRWRRLSRTTRRWSWSGGGKWGCFDERSERNGRARQRQVVVMLASCLTMDKVNVHKQFW